MYIATFCRCCCLFGFHFILSFFWNQVFLQAISSVRICMMLIMQMDPLTRQGFVAISFWKNMQCQPESTLLPLPHSFIHLLEQLLLFSIITIIFFFYCILFFCRLVCMFFYPPRSNIHVRKLVCKLVAP